jgi:hypothetical protein
MLAQLRLGCRFLCETAAQKLNLGNRINDGTEEREMAKGKIGNRWNKQ